MWLVGVFGIGARNGRSVAVALLLALHATGAVALSGDVVLEESTDYRCTYPMNYVDVVRGQGRIDLVLPAGDGPVSGQGSFEHQGTGYTFAGPMILEGEVRGGTLHFPFPAAYSGGQRVYNRSDPVSIELRLDATAVTPVDFDMHGAKCSGTVTWRLTKALERWRITIDDTVPSIAIVGKVSSENHAGVEVHVQRVIDVSVERGQYKTGTGTARLAALDGYCRPPGAYACKPAAVGIVGTGTDIDFERLDQTKWAARFNPPKNPHDAALKAQWEKLRQHKTPVVYPESFAAGGQLNGRTLALSLPKSSGFTVGIYCRRLVADSGMVAERIATNPTPLPLAFKVQLVDGWRGEVAHAGSKAAPPWTARWKSRLLVRAMP